MLGNDVNYSLLSKAENKLLHVLRYLQSILVYKSEKKNCLKLQFLNKS